MFKTQQYLIICIFPDCVEPRSRPIPPPRNRRVNLADDATIASYADVADPQGNRSLPPYPQSGVYPRSPIHSTDVPSQFESDKYSTDDYHSGVWNADLNIEGEHSPEGMYEDLDIVSSDLRRTYDNLSSTFYHKMQLLYEYIFFIFIPLLYNKTLNAVPSGNS